MGQLQTCHLRHSSSNGSHHGESVHLAPYSYSNVIAHDPPTLVVGFGNRQQGQEIPSSMYVISARIWGFLEGANSAAEDARG